MEEEKYIENPILKIFKNEDDKKKFSEGVVESIKDSFNWRMTKIQEKYSDMELRTLSKLSTKRLLLAIGFALIFGFMLGFMLGFMFNL